MYSANYCEEHLEEGKDYIRDTKTNKRYDKPGDLSLDLGCKSCTELITCKFANLLIDIVTKQDEKIFRRNRR